MTPHYQDDLVTVHHGDCLDVMATLADCSVDAVVTDPPYGLGFMGKDWDDLPPGEPWARECLRVLKPGGHLLAFGGTRTAHRLACAIEDAGFEIRDTIAWLYGSGFPKSLDVSKAIDKAAGAPRTEVIGTRGLARWSDGAPAGVAMKDDGGIRQNFDVVNTLLAPATPEAEKWQGWGTALKPANEPIIVARKPPTGTVAANVLAHGAGALNIDGCRTQGAEREVTGRGRWPTNVVLDPDAAADLDRQSGVLTSGFMASGQRLEGTRNTYGNDAKGGYLAPNDTYGDSGGASRFFPTFRYEAKAPQHERPKVVGDPTTARQVADKGGSKRCVNCGKQAVNVGNSSCSCVEPDFQHERQDGYIAHPTVKPLDLMRWLVRLVTPPGGVVLEPFAGSGTTAEACIIEGFRCIAIEREADYLPLILTRITKPIEPVLFGMEAS